ncbi:MAG TPA: ABC-2 family transporter protein [Polyangiaceae bacterium]|nr:ABC-2 family transporter protein [Polyangiaceae bacterium]
MRLLRLIRIFWATALLAEIEYRVNFLLAALNSMASLAGALFGLSLFFRHGATLGGWSWNEALVVLGLFTALSGLSSTLLTPNLNRIVEQVKDGTLDFVLLKPVDSQFWLSLRRFSPWGIPDVLFGLGLLIYGASGASGALLNLPGALLPLIACVVILYSLWFIMATTTVWFVQIYNVTEVLRSMLDAGRFPIDAFPSGAYRFVFTFLVPVAFLTTVPARAVLGLAHGVDVVLSGAVAIALFACSRAFWRFALRFYTSASS